MIGDKQSRKTSEPHNCSRMDRPQMVENCFPPSLHFSGVLPVLCDSTDSLCMDPPNNMYVYIHYNYLKAHVYSIISMGVLGGYSRTKTIPQ